MTAVVPAVPESKRLLEILGVSEGLRGTDETLAMVLPLLRQVLRVHEASRVAPLAGLEDILVTGGKLWFENGKTREVRTNRRRIRELQRQESQAFTVVDHTRRVEDLSTHLRTDGNLAVGDRGVELSRPMFLAGYVSWEHEVEHHDALTDIFVLGLIIASVALDLDLSDDEQLLLFVEARTDVRKSNERIHPVVSRVIAKMTQLNRHERAQDLRSVLLALEKYREHGAGDSDIVDVAGFNGAQDPTGRRAVICEHLRNRLFDLSRRNRLLYFRATGQTLNLTEVSVPLMLDYQNLATDKLLTWQGAAAASLSKSMPVQLGTYLRFEDYPFLPGVLDRIRTRAVRDQAEYGVSSLRIAVCFLHWHNFKDDAKERIHTPLLLLPANLVKKKGVRDSYVLEPTSEQAEVNPILRHMFKKIYDIELPQNVDLTTPESVRALYEFLVQQVEASEPGVAIDYMDRPRIDLLQSRVKRRLSAFKKRTKLTGRGVRRFGEVEYSYREDNFQPLGLRLFSTRVTPAPAPMRDLVGEPLPRVFQMTSVGAEHGAGSLGPDGEREIESRQYTLRKDEAPEPYRWAFDLCFVTLGNFNYQKISLVRDYAGLLEEGGRENAAFDTLFSTEASQVTQTPNEVPLEERHDVVPADPSQLGAIARSRGGQSYIIQGPPGTGKSQTITNLIADYVAQGKRVLFVCEKRAAIDVVYFRLKQQGLDALSSLIHDSQTDKKAFIQDVKSTYESWSSAGASASTGEVDEDGGTDAVASRRTQIADLARQYEVLERFSDAMLSPAEGTEHILSGLIRRAIELEAVAPQLSPVEREYLPRHGDMVQHLDLLVRCQAALASATPGKLLAQHPVRMLSAELLSAERPIQKFTEALLEIRPALARLKVGQLETSEGGASRALADIYARVDFVKKVRLLAENGLLGLLEAGSVAHHRLLKASRRLARQEKAALAAREKTTSWADPLDESEANNAVGLARRFDGMLFRFAYPAFWRLRRILRARYAFASAVVPPSYVQVLEGLLGHYSAQRGVVESRAELAEELGLGEQADRLSAIERLTAEIHDVDLTTVEEALRIELIGEGGVDSARRLLAVGDEVDRLRSALAGIVSGYGKLNVEELGEALRDLEGCLEHVPELIVVLRELENAPAEFRDAVKTLPLTSQAFEAAVGAQAIEQTYRMAPEIGKFDGSVLKNVVERLSKLHTGWRSSNAAAIVQTCRSRFLNHLRITQTPAAGLTQQEKSVKKDYVAGRRELEHEFGKVMRFRSIRDLMSNRSGDVIRDLKPIWLMSPLSVADTLPCTVEFFDVVIFDEASQIPLEDAVPAIYRAEQCIIVGDQMQLPPSKFFASSQGDDDETVLFEENEEDISYDLDADSLLNHASRSLPSTMLEWHYRSRHEELISFCNEAFYGGRLLTIPTPHLPTQSSKLSREIQAFESTDGKRGAHQTLARPVSFHRLQDSIYENRRNRGEAQYIAEMVREFLAIGRGELQATLSMGIVAFSEAQQGEIEKALDNLAADDPAFRTALDAEFEREEDGQFCGLFVKNLENVQGDERDLIILSVCYAQDRSGKMLMNFGPINKNGGEKRLNVIFSRSKRRMAVVSSIDYGQITNEYNDGASALRGYLRYAAGSSRGDLAEVEAALSGMAVSRRDSRGDIQVDPVKIAVAERLRERGLRVDLDVGASRFRCDLVVRSDGEASKTLAVLIDSDGFYRGSGVDERFRLKPSVLEAFGWQVETVLGKDWLEDSDGVVERLVACCE